MKTNLKPAELKEEAHSGSTGCCGRCDSLHRGRHDAGNPRRRHSGGAQENPGIPEIGELTARAKDGELSPIDSQGSSQPNGVLESEPFL